MRLFLFTSYVILYFICTCKIFAITSLVDSEASAAMMYEVVGSNIKIDILHSKKGSESSKQILKAGNADLIVVLTKETGDWMKNVPTETKIVLSELIDQKLLLLINSDKERIVNPYFWTDSKIALNIANALKDTLSLLYPDLANNFNTNVLLFEKKIEVLNRTMADKMKNLRNKATLTSSFAFDYFFKIYKITKIEAKTTLFDPQSNSKSRYKIVISEDKMAENRELLVDNVFVSQKDSLFSTEFNHRLKTIKIDELAKNPNRSITYSEILNSFADRILRLSNKFY